MGKRQSRIEYTDIEIPWVDLERFYHIGRDAHELAQYERRLFRYPLSDDKLHRCRIHAIAQRGDHAKVGGREQGIKLVLFDGLMATSDKSVSLDDKERDEDKRTNGAQG
jgi:hypothetical protein